jgi:hypothetical protein
MRPRSFAFLSPPTDSQKTDIVAILNKEQCNSQKYPKEAWDGGHFPMQPAEPTDLGGSVIPRQACPLEQRWGTNVNRIRQHGEETLSNAGRLGSRP